MALRVTTSQPKVKLKVTTAPTYSGTLRVGSTSTARGSTQLQGSSYNPQKSVSTQRTANIAPKTYNPQKTITATQLNNAKVSDDWAKKEATRLRQEADRKAAERRAELKRLADAKNIEIEGNKQGWLGKLTFQSDFKARNARETASQYLEYNSNVVYPNLLARQRNFEVEQGRRYQEAVDAIQNAKSEAEFNSIIAEFEDWEKRTIDSLNADITAYTTEQELLEQYAGTPISSFTGNALGSTKRLGQKVGGAGWNALSWTVSQPRRAINAGINFVNPNRKRLYEDGSEQKRGADITSNIKGGNPLSRGWSQLQNAYNATKNADGSYQRVFGYDKDQEAEMIRRAGTPEWEHGRSYGKGMDEFRAKYTDDFWDLVADPLNFLPNNWFGKSTKAVKGSKAGQQVAKLGSKFSDEAWRLASKSKKLSNYLISREARKANPNSFRNWLTKRVGTSTDDFFGDNKKLIKFRNEASEELGKRADDWQRVKKGFSAKTQAGLSKLTDDEARILQEYMLPHTFGNNAKSKYKIAKNVFDWDKVEVPRGFSKASRNKIEDLARALKNESDTLTRMSLDYDEFYNAGQNAKRYLKGAKAYKRGQGLQYSYVPNYNSKPSVGGFDDVNKSRNASRWWLKQKASDNRIRQSAQQLKTSFGKRASAQLYNDTNAGRWLANNADDYTSAIDDATKALNWRKQGYGNSVWNKLNTASIKNPASPLKLWRKAVLALNPSWYVNNIATNIPFSFSAGGLDVIPEYLRLLKKSGRVFDDLPEGVRGSLDEFVGGGRLGKLGSKIEDTSRIATFRALKRKGFSDADALRDMNRWLFDYSVKNWERPIRNVAPFYKWQANLMRQSVQMPFTRPRSAKFYDKFNQKFFRDPINNLPDYPQTYVDENGQEQTFNPKEGFKGKMLVGYDENGNPKFASTPFWAMNPDTMTDFGINPFLSTAMDMYTSQDKWGRRNTDRNTLQLLGERFPQYNYYNAFREKDQKLTSKYFAQGGNSKWKQGYDPSLPNYDKSMDKGREFKRRQNSFWGGQIFNQTTFDKAEYDKKFRLSQFNKEFFAIDWEKEYDKDYNKARAKQEALAGKYGFDYKKDIIDDYWTKNDTPTTTATKRAKEDARQFSRDFWESYNALPQGSRTQASVRRPFLINKYKEWADNNAFLENGYRRIPKFTVYKDGQPTSEKAEKNLVTLRSEETQSQARLAIGKAKYQRYLEYQKAKKTGDWSWFEKNGGGSQKARDYKKATETGDWTEWRKKYGDTRKSTPYQYDGKYFKSQETMDKYIEGKFWRDYYALDNTKDRQALLAEFPQFKLYDQPQTQEEWDRVRQLLREKRNRDLATVDGFSDIRQATKKRIETSFRKGFGGRRLKYKF